jgi:S-adenosylmethionine:tRNA-ribosyltransferase-isomerase (queuine synthetase)
VRISDFDYHLPEELIAQEPLADRSASRMLHLRRYTGEFADRRFIEFPDLLRSDDLLVVNNSRVFPARLFGHRSGRRAQPLSPIQRPKTFCAAGWKCCSLEGRARSSGKRWCVQEEKSVWVK